MLLCVDVDKKMTYYSTAIFHFLFSKECYDVMLPPFCFTARNLISCIHKKNE